MNVDASMHMMDTIIPADSVVISLSVMKQSVNVGCSTVSEEEVEDVVKKNALLFEVDVQWLNSTNEREILPLLSIHIPPPISPFVEQFINEQICSFI